MKKIKYIFYYYILIFIKNKIEKISQTSIFIIYYILQKNINKF
jgi:hypothetical protein